MTAKPDGNGRRRGLARRAFLLGVLLACGLGADTLLARDDASQVKVEAQPLLKHDLPGEPGKEVNAQGYTFPPGAVLPWHIHPDAHEIAYVLEGTFTFQIEGEAERTLQAGEVTYLAPNIVHRGMNKGSEPVKLFVVRIKPKDKPLVQEVPGPQ